MSDNILVFFITQDTLDDDDNNINTNDNNKVLGCVSTSYFTAWKK